MATALNTNNKKFLSIEPIEDLIYTGTEEIMAVGYKEMAEINLQLSEICFAAESEVEKIYKEDSGE